MLTEFLEEAEKEANANAKYAKEFHFATHDKILLIGQTSALLACLQNRCTDIARLLRIVEVQREGLEFYASAQKISGARNLGEPNIEMGLMPRKLGTLASEILIQADAIAAGEGE